MLLQLHLPHVQDLSAIQGFIAFFVGVITFLVTRAFYNAFLSPLSRFPGPKVAAATDLWITRAWLSGSYPMVIKKLHDRYGPVVRLGTNEISFSSSQSWKDIYGHRSGSKDGKGPFLKSSWYDMFLVKHIVSVSDPREHSRLRKLLSNAFSAKALTEQEEFIAAYVDKFIKQIGKYCGPETGGDDAVKWFNFMTFDVIGDLSFGAPFGSLDDGKPHFWVTSIFETVFTFAVASIPHRFPLLKRVLGQWVYKLLPAKVMAPQKRNMEYSRNRVIRRMNTQTTRKDFMTKILEEKDSENMSIEEMTANLNMLIVAGSETTATALLGITYFVCRSPRVYAKLVSLIRERYKTYEDINSHSTEVMPYLNAVIDEGLRVYPPAPLGLPRVSNGGMVDGWYVPEGVEVYTTGWASTHSEDNFHKPFEFIPERWLDPSNTDDKAASQPFELGSRMCIGKNLALMEIRLTLAKLFWTYDVELVDDELDWIRDNKVYFLWEKPKMNIRVRKRAGLDEETRL